jgi:hypothetical protein
MSVFSSNNNLSIKHEILLHNLNYIYDNINDYGLDLDVEIEAKAKELAVSRYKNETVFEFQV